MVQWRITGSYGKLSYRLYIGFLHGCRESCDVSCDVVTHVQLDGAPQEQCRNEPSDTVVSDEIAQTPYDVLQIKVRINHQHLNPICASLLTNIRRYKPPTFEGVCHLYILSTHDKEI